MLGSGQSPSLLLSLLRTEQVEFRVDIPAQVLLLKAFAHDKRLAFVL